MVGAGETCLGMRNCCMCGGERGVRGFMTVSVMPHISMSTYHSTTPYQCVKTHRLLHPYFGHLSCVYKLQGMLSI